MKNPALALTAASFKMFFRNRQALFFTLFTPLLIMLIFGYIGFDQPPKIDVGIVARQPGEETAGFVNQIKQFPTFKIKEGSLKTLRDKLDKGDLAVILDIPDDLLPPDPATGVKKIAAYVNEGKKGEAQAVVSILNQFMDKTTLAVVRAPVFFKIYEQKVNSNNLRYIEFLLPGLIALSVMQMSVFSVAFVFTQYKEKGVLKRLLATPMRPYQFVSANIAVRLVVAVLQTFIFIAVGLLLFKARVIGSYWLLLLCVVLGALMFLGLGFTISGLAKTVDAVPVLANLVVFPMLFLGGTFFAISNMPPWLQMIAKFLPLTYFSTAVREVMTKDAGLWDIKWNLLGMAVWGVVLIALATVTFSFQEKEGV